MKNITIITAAILWLCCSGAARAITPQELLELTTHAEQGEAAAQCRLGELYRLGAGVPMDMKKAVELFRKAAGQGLADAQYNLGLCYDMGEIDIDDETRYKECSNWYRLAAEQECAEAAGKLGILCTTDHSEYIKWLYKAVGLGDAEAADYLVWENRDDKPTLPPVTLQDKQYAQAMRSLPQDKEEAVCLLFRAAVHGHKPSTYCLALCYKRGEGVQKNPGQAARWYANYLAPPPYRDYDTPGERLRLGREFARTKNDAPVPAHMEELARMYTVRHLLKYLPWVKLQELLPPLS